MKQAHGRRSLQYNYCCRFFAFVLLLVSSLVFVHTLLRSRHAQQQKQQNQQVHLQRQLSSNQSLLTSIQDAILSGDQVLALHEQQRHRMTQANCPAYQTVDADNNIIPQQGRQGSPLEQISLGLSRTFVERMNTSLAFQSMELLGVSTNKNGGKAKYEFYKEWIDDNGGTTLIVKESNTQDPVCHGVFRTNTTSSAPGLNPIDQWQTVLPRPRRIKNSDCKVSRGFFEDVLKTGYIDQVRRAVSNCVALCPDENCPLILSGWGIGAGNALVAAIDLREYQPQIITFGGMRTIVGDDPDFPCHDLDTTRHFRFVSTNREGEYDEIVRQRHPPNNVQVGHAILMEDGQNYPMAYTGLDDDTSRGPGNVKVHERAEYQQRVDQMIAINEACYPIPVGNWPLGHKCGYNDECANGNCRRNTCDVSLLSRGMTCLEDDDCSSGNCHRPAVWPFSRARCIRNRDNL